MAAVTAGGRIKFPPTPTSFLGTVHYFLTSLVSDSTSAQKQWPGPLLALAASLSLHLLVFAILHATPGSAGHGLSRPATSAVVVTLAGSASREVVATLATPDRPVDSIEPVASGVPRAAHRLAPSLPAVESPALSLNLPLHSWYFARSELTVPPALEDEPVILAPEERAGDASSTGKTVLRVFVGADGSVDRIEVASSNLPLAYDAAAVAGFSRARFRPGEIAGVAVGSELRFEIAFEDGESGASNGPGLIAGGELPVGRHVLQQSSRATAEASQDDLRVSSSVPGQRQGR